MYKIGNARMLEIFQADGEIRHYFSCVNIANAGGERWGIRSVEYYASNPDARNLEFAEFSANAFGELAVRINAADSALIADVCRKISEIQSEYERVSIETPAHIDLSRDSTILEYFTVSNVYELELGVYGLLSPERIPPLETRVGLEVRAATEDDVAAAKSLGVQEWGGFPMMLARVYKPDSDLLFVAYLNGEPAGLLCANCNYKNIYDVVNVFTHGKFRGRHIATALATYYAQYCVNHGLIPHYGTAVSAESERVALNSGFEETSRNHSFDVAPAVK
ncbi:MAG: GNAT family N-acetyltransferase [Oscillospiraceae bacterium]|jgi:hypothetical protein|nr:GNAT family N-acetyltransferase [Oscillospiraceae bacterium]